MRLLMITQDFPPRSGGVARYAAALAERLAPKSDTFVLAAPHHPEAAHADAALGYEVARIRVSHDLVGMAAPLAVRRVPFDTIFCAQWGAAPAAAAWRRAGGVKRLAVAAHGRELLLEPWPPALMPIYRAIRRSVVTSADRLLPVSHYTASLLRGLGAERHRITVVNNGVDANRFETVDAAHLRSAHGLEGRRIILTVCRLVRRKGVDTILAALDRIAEAVPEVTLVVVGEGPDRGRLERLAGPLGERVRFLGPVPESDLAAWYSLAEVFVMPARSEPPDVEGFGLVFLEAGAAGKPVIGARAGGVVDAIAHERTGLLVAPNDPFALAQAIRRLLGDAALRRRLGEAGRAHARAWSWDRVADEIAHALALPEAGRADPRV